MGTQRHLDKTSLLSIDGGELGGEGDSPSPLDLVTFLPWAAHQLSLEQHVMVTSVTQNEYVSSDRPKGKSKGKAKLRDDASDRRVPSEDERPLMVARYRPEEYDDMAVHIDIVLDAANKVVQIKFVNNKRIPRQVIKILALVARFHPLLAELTVRGGGLDAPALHELPGLLSNSALTDLCLDGCPVSQADFRKLIHSTALRHLSLARCGIEDTNIRDIAAGLMLGEPAAETLIVLNLTSNRITDAGIEYLAEALRANRKLSYLNLAGNMLTNSGVFALLASLEEFLLTGEEWIAMRKRRLVYLRHRQKLMDDTVKRLREESDLEKKINTTRKKRLSKSGLGRKGKESEKEVDAPSYFNEAEALVDSEIGEFCDPYNDEATVVRDGMRYCRGNNSLSYLGLAYNDLTYLALPRLLRVLMRQKMLGRKPRGLINVSLEGNRLPTSCKELGKIDNILEIGLMNMNPRLSVVMLKRRATVHKLNPN